MATNLPKIPNTDPERYPLDAFRISVAASVHKGLPAIPLDKAYEAVDINRKGVDFSIAIPRFKLGGKPDAWAKKVEESVSNLFRLSHSQLSSADAAFVPLVCGRRVHRIRQGGRRILDLHGENAECAPERPDHNRSPVASLAHRRGCLRYQ